MLKLPQPAWFDALLLKKHKGERIWVTQKSIEAEEKWALKKEERLKEINENKL